MGIDLTGRRVLVVGASSGIGRAVAIHAVRAGADVVFAARRQDLLEEAIAEAGGGRVAVGDVGTTEGCQAIGDAAGAALGAIDLVVYAAGMSPIKQVRHATAEEWAQVFAVNVIGASLTTAACLPHLAPGAIVSYLSSDSSQRPRFSLVPYAASKAALESTVKGWRIEHREFRFANVVIGPTLDTNFGSGFDMNEVMTAFPVWLAHADIQVKSMTSSAVAAVLLSSLGAALAHPEIDVQDLVLRPPGPLASSYEDLVAVVEDNHE